MMIEEMNRFPILARAGAFPVNKKSPQASMRALQYSVDELCDNKKSLWIFPQGIIRPPMYRPIEFQTGLAYIAKNVAKKARRGQPYTCCRKLILSFEKTSPKFFAKWVSRLFWRIIILIEKSLPTVWKKTLKRFATSSLKTSDTATLKITSICTNKNSNGIKNSKNVWKKLICQKAPEFNQNNPHTAGCACSLRNPTRSPQQICHQFQNRKN